MADSIDLKQVELYLMRWRDNYFFGKYREGCSHYFVLKEDNSSWEIIPFGSQKWNSIDQQLWKGHDIEKSYGEGCSQKFVPDWLPPIPTLEEMKQVKSVSWKDNFMGKAIIPSDELPNLKKHFIDNEIKEKEIYFALVEDLYESSCGDGVYRYPEKFSFSQIEIEDYINRILPNREVGNTFYYGKKGYLTKETLVYDGKNFTIPDFAPGTFEHYKLDDLILIAEELCDSYKVKYLISQNDKEKIYALVLDGKIYERLSKKDEHGYNWVLSDENITLSEYYSYSKYEHEEVNYGTKFNY